MVTHREQKQVLHSVQDDKIINEQLRGIALAESQKVCRWSGQNCRSLHYADDKAVHYADDKAVHYADDKAVRYGRDDTL